jgi:hypothetical protein
MAALLPVPGMTYPAPWRETTQWFLLEQSKESIFFKDIDREKTTSSYPDPKALLRDVP